MIGLMGREIKEMEIVKLQSGEAVVVVWANPGQLMRLKVEHPSFGFVDLKVQVIGLVVKEKKAEKKVGKKKP